jgi:hypothetical protein
MKLFIKSRKWLAIVALSWAVIACSSKLDADNAPTSQDTSAVSQSIDVYKSPSCGCCANWVSHIEAADFSVAVHHPSDLNKLKDDKGILPRYQSCHTAVNQEGYVFEGHIPADVIKRFLANPPANALGLAVPGMPVGSPGMEMGDRYDEYDVLLLGKDGSSTVFEHIAKKQPSAAGPI